MTREVLRQDVRPSGIRPNKVLQGLADGDGQGIYIADVYHIIFRTDTSTTSMLWPPPAGHTHKHQAGTAFWYPVAPAQPSEAVADTSAQRVKAAH